MTTVYTKPNCVQCDATKRYLDKAGIEYSVVDVMQEPEALDLILGLGFQAAPVVVSDSGNWSGFQPDKLNLLAS